MQHVLLLEFNIIFYMLTPNFTMRISTVHANINCYKEYFWPAVFPVGPHARSIHPNPFSAPRPHRLPPTPPFTHPRIARARSRSRHRHEHGDAPNPPPPSTPPPTQQRVRVVLRIRPAPDDAAGAGPPGQTPHRRAAHGLPAALRVTGFDRVVLMAQVVTPPIIIIIYIIIQ